MPRAKSINSYSPLFWQIVEAVAIRGEQFESELPSMKAALSLRGKFYAFRGALKREVDLTMLKPASYTQDQISRLIDTWNYSQSVVCWIDQKESGPVPVRFMHRDQTPESLFLKAMLAKGQAVPVGDEQAAADSQKRMQELLEAGNAKKNPYY